MKELICVLLSPVYRWDPPLHMYDLFRHVSFLIIAVADCDLSLTRVYVHLECLLRFMPTFFTLAALLLSMCQLFNVQQKAASAKGRHSFVS